MSKFSQVHSIGKLKLLEEELGCEKRKEGYSSDQLLR